MGQQTSDKPEKLINGDGTDERTLPTTDDHSSPDGVRQHPDERKKKEQEQPKSVVAYGDVESVATGRWESADEASAASPTTGPPPSSPPPGDDSDTDGVRYLMMSSSTFFARGILQKKGGQDGGSLIRILGKTEVGRR